MHARVAARPRVAPAREEGCPLCAHGYACTRAGACPRARTYTRARESSYRAVDRRLRGLRASRLAGGNGWSITGPNSGAVTWL